jgi:hypothetical protein
VRRGSLGRRGEGTGRRRESIRKRRRIVSNLTATARVILHLTTILMMTSGRSSCSRRNIKNDKSSFKMHSIITKI